MCLFLNPDSKILVARTDIRVGKWLQIHGDNLCSPYHRRIKWKRRETKSVQYFTGTWGVKIEDDDRLHIEKEVNRGLHCYGVAKARAEAVWRTKQTRYTARIYEAIIPKGTKYIRGRNGEVVALKLKLTGRLFR